MSHNFVELIGKLEDLFAKKVFQIICTLVLGLLFGFGFGFMIHESETAQSIIKDHFNVDINNKQISAAHITSSNKYKITVAKINKEEKRAIIVKELQKVFPEAHEDNTSIIVETGTASLEHIKERMLKTNKTMEKIYEQLGEQKSYLEQESKGAVATITNEFIDGEIKF